MKRVFSLVLISLFVFAATVAHAEEVLDVNTIIKNINPDTMTKVQLQDYYKTIRGKNARGKGKVVDVKPGRRGFKITILTSASSPEKGYNIVLYGKGDAPTDLNKNETISFEGEVGRVSTFRGVSVDIRGTYSK